MPAPRYLLKMTSLFTVLFIVSSCGLGSSGSDNSDDNANSDNPNSVNQHVVRYSHSDLSIMHYVKAVSHSEGVGYASLLHANDRSSNELVEASLLIHSETGEEISSFHIPLDILENGEQFSIAINSSLDVMIVWHEPVSIYKSGFDLFSLIVSQNGQIIQDKTQINSTDKTYWSGQVITSPSGDFVISWVGYRETLDGLSSTVYLKEVDATGETTTDVLPLVFSQTHEYIQRANLKMDSQNRYIVVFEDRYTVRRPDTNERVDRGDLYVSRFSDLLSV